ncbi:MAG: hypothetical protein AAGE59_24225 [Cyanobacteria bacterium P01_F01_bin.86]
MLLSHTPFYDELNQAIAENGGIFNAHLHLDRAGTIEAKYMSASGVQQQEASSISLAQKHGIISILHNGLAYDSTDLSRRVAAYIEMMIAAGTSRADTVVDVSCDRVGLSALQTLSELQQHYAQKIDLRLGAYSPLGFTDAEPERWQLLQEAAEIADFIGSLPERDDRMDYPDHIGFYENCRRVLELGCQLGKPIHFHVDQRNEPSEQATEILVEAVEEFGAPISDTDEPMIWAIHAISPSTYEEPRFKRLLTGLAEQNIGVICCPSAAIGMRQLRPLLAPTYNSIARVLEMLAAGIQVRLGSDNIADICAPSATPDLRDEIFVLSNAIRFYDVGILAKLAAGKRLSSADRDLIQQHLVANEREIQKVLTRGDRTPNPLIAMSST